MNDPLLSLNVSVDYPGKTGVLRNVTLDVHAGEIVGLVGQSGSGKSTLAMTILRLVELNGGRARGSIRFHGRDLMTLDQRELRGIRGKEIGLVLQSPMSALNPALKIGTQLKEAWRCQGGDSGTWKQRVMELLESVSLPPEEAFLRKYSRQLSVGLAQRVLIAMAILHRPLLLLADEPTSALDVITQAEILDLFARLSRELKMAVLFISHDLLSVARLCQRVAILHAGEIVEVAATNQIFEAPRHPYTQRLVGALPPPLGTSPGLVLSF
ncbi:MAG: oligopeptide/dipeptide transporter,ATP-binding protein C-terminal domain [Bryobacterales bacterium]|nr:oligopeptide/dipeptide transporter,ATP-binding protein C-terminal domain [Bryobacterales bacterium]